jgi:hypothetical protein
MSADRELVITGEIKEGENGKRRRSSRRAGRFEYRTYLPGDIKPDQRPFLHSGSSRPRRLALASGRELSERGRIPLARTVWSPDRHNAGLLVARSGTSL